MTAIAIQNRDQIIDRVSQGQFVDDIAQDLGIATPNISKHLSKDPEYRQAREIGAGIRLDRAEKAVAEIAQLGVTETGVIVGITQEQGNLARVRDSVLKAQQWRCQAEHPHIYAGKGIQVNIGAVLNLDPASVSSIGALLERAAPQQIDVIEGEIGEKDVTP